MAEKKTTREGWRARESLGMRGMNEPTSERGKEKRERDVARE